MPIPINELGGLTDAQIDLRIDAATDKQVERMDAKLKEHQQVIENRLEKTEQAVSEVRDKASELKADVAVLVASDANQTELLKEIVRKGDEWHDADVEFRTGLVQRVVSIETEQKRLSGQVKMIRWFVATSGAATRALGCAVKLIATEEFWKVAGVAIVLFILSHISPYLFHLVQGIFAGH